MAHVPIVVQQHENTDDPTSSRPSQESVVGQCLNEERLLIESPPPLRPRTRSDDTGTSTTLDTSPELQLPLRLRVVTKAEVSEATMTSDERLWAVAQIHAEVPVSPATTVPSDTSVAVAIVLDNS